MNDRNRDRLQPPNQRGGGRQDHYNNDGNQYYNVPPPSNNLQQNRERFPSPSQQRDDPYRIVPQREPILDNRRTRCNEQLGDEPYYDNLPLQNERIINRRVDRDHSDYREEEQPLRYQHQRRQESPDREFVDQRDYGRDDRHHPGPPRDFVDRPSQQQHERDRSPRRNLEPSIHRENYGRDYRRTELHYPQRDHLEDDIQRQSPQLYRGVDQQQAEQPIRGRRQQAEIISEEPPHHFRREEHERYQHQLRQPSPQQQPGRRYDRIYDVPPLQNHEQPGQLPYVPPVYEEPLRHPLPHEDEAERQRPRQSLDQRGRDQPQADTFYEAEQLEHDDDYPPSEVHQRPKQQNAFNNARPLRHDYRNIQQNRQAAQDETYNIASTAPLSAFVPQHEAEEPLEDFPPPRNEYVEVQKQEIPQSTRILPWHVRQIVPRQRNNRGNDDQNFIAEAADDAVVTDLNDDWDSVVDTPLQQQQQQTVRGGHDGYPTRGGRGAGGRGGANVSAGNFNRSYVDGSLPNTGGNFEDSPVVQQRQHQEDDYMGFEEEEAAVTLSYRPPGGGFGRGNNLNHRDFERRGYGQASTGYAGYSGYQQQDSQGGKRVRAPRGYQPKKRQLDDIFNDDRNELNKYGNTVCDGDAEMEVDGEPVRQHFDNWEEMDIAPQLLKNLKELSDYIKPRNIQKVAIPYIQEGHNVKVQSETGSGKTVAFLVPIIDNLIALKNAAPLPSDGPLALIVAPTRELVTQLYEQARKLTNNTDISVSYAYGQYGVAENILDIKAGMNILVACVGRLLDLVERKVLSLRTIRYLIIDEPDRLLRDYEDGCDFLKLITHVQLPFKHDRQTMLFSATLSDPSVETLNDYIDMKNLVSIKAMKQSNIRVKYNVMAVPSYPSKFRYLMEYLKEIKAENGGECPKVLIFINTKVNVDRVAIDITGGGFPATTIHGDRAQDLREEAYNQFRTGKARVLVATDVCARGVDIYDMQYVINYDLPKDDVKTTFLQRCGRTGRIHGGTATSFYCEGEDRFIADILIQVIDAAGQTVPEFLQTSVKEADYKYGQVGGELVAAQFQQSALENVEGEAAVDGTAPEMNEAAVDEEWD
uniref:RNA helicase n=1 Tax=Panagrolaimus davidi TaxID=227884 RepID=A0A914PDX0_9BILA